MNCVMERQSFSSEEDSSDFQHDHDAPNDHHHAVTGVNCTADAEDDWNTEVVLPMPSTSRSHPLPETAAVSESPLTSSPVTVPDLVPGSYHPLSVRWNYYYHLPNDKNWNLESYKLVMGDIGALEQLIAVNESVTENIIKNCMLFVMRAGITPMWEDPQNRRGGCFSYKVTNKTVVGVWRRLTYLLAGYSLTVDPAHMDYVNGITISPKRGFCILKIWMRHCILQDPAVIVNIEHLMRNGCLFKAHSPEF